ncbi:eCIS core domain-containing protein [Serinicoccus sediminis]|uniref:eCIS core domain-containing protein n=1 Tax=Serinicoccus sediminis TaxID=2306021 RepID=UPI00235543FF|nr:DUF4157 domain-containing protein [Serinicoccus sediminis]
MRAVLQAGLGRDLGDVRVHGGPAARRALDAADADALTAEGHVTVRPEHDHATTTGGRVLLLHELVHVLQQRDDPDLCGEREPPAHLEEQARAVAVALGTGAAAPS